MTGDGGATRLPRAVDRLRLRHPGAAGQQEDRHATWLELFFDLVFVLALTGVTDRLGGGTPTAERIAVAAGIFVLVQWAWVGQSYYDTRFDPDDVPHRLLTLIATAGAGLLALGIRHAPAGVLLPAGYLLVRGALLVMYLRVLTGDRSTRDLVTVYGAGFGVGWLLWLVSLMVSPAVRPVLWIAALALELATPWLGRHWLSRYPVHVSHLPERIGQFMIILLGATLANLRDAVPSAHPAARVVVAAGLAVLMPTSIWWIYTTFVTSRLAGARLGNGQVYGYLHVPMGAGVLFMGWGLGEMVREIGEGTGEVPLVVRLLFGGSIIAWMLGGMGLQWFALGRLPRHRLVIGVLGVAPVGVVAGVVTNPWLVLGLTAGVLIGYAVLISTEIVQVGR